MQQNCDTVIQKKNSLTNSDRHLQSFRSNIYVLTNHDIIQFRQLKKKMCREWKVSQKGPYPNKILKTNIYTLR